MLRPQRLLATVLCIATILSGPSVMAWGRHGHRVISRLAESQLAPKTKAAIVALLAPGESLADASTWADEHRRELPETAPWHYVDVPITEPKYDSRFSGDVPEKGCVVEKLHEMEKTVKDPKRTVEERRFALRFLIHLLEDMHMPMHVGDNHDRGGNDTQLQFLDRGTNMHRLWDTDMIERNTACEECWLEDLGKLDSAEARAMASKGTVEDWATESLLLARSAYVEPGSSKAIKSGTKLGEAYAVANLPSARMRIYLAGVRLARVLNEVFADGP